MYRFNPVRIIVVFLKGHSSGVQLSKEIKTGKQWIHVANYCRFADNFALLKRRKLFSFGTYEHYGYRFVLN